MIARAVVHRLYAELPASLRSAAATMRGAYLNARRYGAETDELVAQALERERWSTERIRAWQEERLASLLDRAARRVPYYRAQWAERRRMGDGSSWEMLSNWPILEKEAVRLNSRGFIADDKRAWLMYSEHTSGSTGTPLKLWRSRRTLVWWYALSEARWRRWYGVSRHDAWAIFGGQLVTPVSQQTPPYWVWNAAMKQLYCSVHHLGPGAARAYASELDRREVRFVLGYPSALYALSTEMLAEGLTVPSVRVVIANAEPLWEHQREAISAAFHCPVRETYGMAEMVAAASECEQGSLHLWPEAGLIEVLRSDAASPASVLGGLVCTGILDQDMPLIRYRTGDDGSLEAGSAPCACGRTLAVLSAIEGRRDDVLITRDGRPIGRLDPVFKAGLHLREAQIVQEKLDVIRIRYVAGAGFSKDECRDMADRLRERMGDVHVELEAVPSIPRGANGKFRSVVCALPERDRMMRGEN